MLEICFYAGSLPQIVKRICKKPCKHNPSQKRHNLGQRRTKKHNPSQKTQPEQTQEAQPEPTRPNKPTQEANAESTTESAKAALETQPSPEFMLRHCKNTTRDPSHEPNPKSNTQTKEQTHNRIPKNTWAKMGLGQITRKIHNKYKSK